MSEIKVGDVILHKDGQYECVVLEVLPNGWYLLKDGDTTFKEHISYLIADDEDDFDDDGQPDEYTEWQDYMGGDDWDHGQYDY